MKTLLNIYDLTKQDNHVVILSVLISVCIFLLVWYSINIYKEAPAFILEYNDKTKLYVVKEKFWYGYTTWMAYKQENEAAYICEHLNRAAGSKL